MRLLALLLALLCAPAAAAEVWAKIADEGQTWASVNAPVRFGVPGKWVTKDVAGVGQCTNAYFGFDPAVGLGKVCEALRSFDPPPPAPAASAIRWPSNYFPGADGTPAVLFSTAAVDGLSGFVPDDVAPASSASSPTGWVRSWHWHAYIYCHRDVCNLRSAATTPVRAIAAVRSASGPTAMGAVADAFEKMLSVPPTPAQAFDIAVWKAQACRDASTAPYKTQPPGGWPSDADPLSKCLPEPTVQPPPPVVEYIALGGQAFKLNADGTRSITVWPQPAIKAEPCALPCLIQYGARFCAIPRLSTPQQTVLAGCIPKKP